VKYTGEWRGDRFDGKGTILFSNGAQFNGEWRNHSPHGTGMFHHPDGTQYYGDWRHGKPHGQGSSIASDGSRYYGEWRYGERHGKGSSISPDHYFYEGEWQFGKRHGQGTGRSSDGYRYMGEWCDDTRQDIGTHYRRDGYYYERKRTDGKVDGHTTHCIPHNGKYASIILLPPALQFWVSDLTENVDRESIHIHMLGSCVEYRSPGDKQPYRTVNFMKKFERCKPPIDVEEQLSHHYPSSQISNNGDLHITQDAQNLQQFFEGYSKYWNHSRNFEMGIQSAMDEIKQFLGSDCEENSTFILLYSGHGSMPTNSNQGGNWEFQGGVVTLEMVLEIWTSSLAFLKHSSTHLGIVIDSCYSGCWVERLKNPDYKTYRVVIQASTKPHQPSRDTKFGGAFLCSWLKRQLHPEIKINLPHSPSVGATFGGHGGRNIVLSSRLVFSDDY